MRHLSALLQMRCDSPGGLQVWKDALVSKQQSPYMRHTLAGGTLRDLHFCPYEVLLSNSLQFSLPLSH